MKINFEKLKGIAMFDGIAEKDLEAMISCIGAKVGEYKNGEAVFLAGDKPQYAGIVLTGQVCAVQEDFYGNRNILAHIPAGELFGEAFACAGVNTLPVSVFATEKSEILMMNFGRIMNVCANSCAFHSRLVFNMMKILSRKNLTLNQKVQLLSKRTTREKLLAFLSSQAKRAGGKEFSIPFNRQELADFLSVDRSAMSAELCRMRDEGILEFQKNKFILN